MTSLPKGRILWVRDVSWEGLAALWQRGSECRGSGGGWMQTGTLGMPRLSQGSHTAYTGLAAESCPVVSAKGMSWPSSASFMVKKCLKCPPIACQLLPTQCPVLWRAHRQRHLIILANSPSSSREQHKGVTLGLAVSCRRKKWAFDGTSSKTETLISSPLSCYSRPMFKFAKQASI